MFNSQQFWAAHEVLEDLWRQSGRNRFVQGLILFAAAYVHVQKNNAPGCLKVMNKSLVRLRPHSPQHWGVNVAGLIRQAEGVLATLATLAALPSSSHLSLHLPYPQLPSALAHRQGR